MARWGRRANKNDIRNRSKRIWACKKCGTWHSNIKPALCTACDSPEMLYFASKAEAVHYAKLKLLQDHGKISRLNCQVPFRFEHNGHHICTYYADFTYVDGDGNHIVVDVKGYADDVYKLKRRMMAAFYGIEIQEVKA